MFSPQRELPKVTSARLLRWAIQMSAYDYDIQYVKRENIPHADALSRLDFESDLEDQKDFLEKTFVHWTETDVISVTEIERETKNDVVLSGILRRVMQNSWSNCSVAERPFKAVRQSLSCEDGILCKGDLMIPPTILRNRILDVHDVHCGTTATRNRLKLEAWWPGYCDEVERYVKQCDICCKMKPNISKHTYVAKGRGSMVTCSYGSRICSWSWSFINFS
jgi:hypothetical protein